MKIISKSKLFKRPLRYIPFLILALLEIIGKLAVEGGIPTMGHVTLSGLTALAFVLINNRYITNDNEAFLEEQIAHRTKELRESESRFRSLVNNIPGVAYRSLNDERRTMLFISDEIERLTGYPKGDFIQNARRSYRSILHRENPENIRLTLEESLRKGETFRLEYRLLDKRGRTRWVMDKGTGIMDTKGEVHYVVGVLVDITEEKRLAREKEKLERQYRQAQKMESIGRLAGGISHDLNNLLTPILGYSELLRPLMYDNREGEKYTDEIIGASLRARDLVQQLLTYSRHQQADFTDFDLNTLIEDFGGLLRKTVRNDIDLLFKTAAVHLPVRGNRNQIEQIIMNLTVNALDAMPEGGRITIETGAQEDRVLLIVSDTGKGMDKKTEEHLFEPFFSTKGNRGTGLGLATVYGIIQNHKGNIQVNTREGKGSEFRIDFPRALLKAE